MIEVNLYSIPAGESSANVGKCIARSRFDKETMGVGVEEFVKGFLKENAEKFEAGLGNGITEMINSSTNLTRKDISCINHYLIQSGYIVKVYNVTDDEENPNGIPAGGVSEWNIIDHNFIQYDYPTATKIIPGADSDVPSILRKVVDQSGLFNTDKFAGLKNPFTEILNNIDRIKKVSGTVHAGLVSKVYQYLDELGFEIFCATSED